VALILFPLDARVYDGDEDLGMMPITVKVAPGEVKHLTVSRRGYVPRRLMIDGSKTRLVVGLIHIGTKGAAQAEAAADRAAERAAAAAAKTAPATATSGAPWSEPASAEQTDDESPPAAPAPKASDATQPKPAPAPATSKD
jgi:hypothetical protein